MMKSQKMKEEQHDHVNNYRTIEPSPHMYLNVDERSRPSTRFNTPSVEPAMISYQSASYFSAPTESPPPLIEEQNKLWPIEKLSKDSSTTEIVTSAQKRNHKHKHHRHHHHHHNTTTTSGKRHCYHHHHHQNRHRRVKSIGQQASDQSSSKIIIANSKKIDQKQQPIIVYREISNDKDFIYDTNPLAKVSYETDNKAASINEQQSPLVVYGDNNMQHSLVNDQMSQPVFVSSDQKKKTSKGNIPLQSVENKIVSQRAASTDETQVSNYPPVMYTQSTPSITSPCGVQQVERIYYEDSCCGPSSSISNCASNSCILQQSNSCGCMSQQPQQQILLCTETNSPEEYIYTTCNNNYIQDSCSQQQQQQYICVDSTPSTIINQMPAFSPVTTNACRSPQTYICVPQTSCQQSPNIIIQPQPQIQSQPLQIIQSPQTSPPGQYLRITSATPQIIETIQSPGFQTAQPQIIQGMQPQIMQGIQPQIIQGMQSQIIQGIQPQIIQGIQPQIVQSIQAAPQALSVSPQMLYQRPYDPIVLPSQNQQFAVTNTPLVAMSQPSYAPARQIPTGPRMFQHALANTVAGRTGVPLPFMQSPMGGQSRGAPLIPTGRVLFNDELQPSTFSTLIPIHSDDSFIPFQSLKPPSYTTCSAFSRKDTYPSSIRNFNRVRQQIQQRAQFLADLEKQIPTRLSSSPTQLANTTALPSRRISPNILQPNSQFLSHISPATSRSPSIVSSFVPPINEMPTSARSQALYAKKNITGTSSSNSSRSSISSSSSVPPARSPSFADTYHGPLLSETVTPYQSL
ncbi:unnamed protein product [Adineta steineri]|uniref:Uncharacterized protein n=1 Tax=Adineta steineri TaxID=433720 RepID=A0A816D8E4_9BILA|nr:unnamed protein product [Adineta steineri]CAF1448393.1 unnamed protein product [Adineta steineri]CAF1629775.1 unnamed protein product [Adineta steineri]